MVYHKHNKNYFGATRLIRNLQNLRNTKYGFRKSFHDISPIICQLSFAKLCVHLKIKT